MNRLFNRFSALLRAGCETGAKLPEYALLLCLVSTVSLGAVQQTGQNAEQKFTEAAQAIAGEQPMVPFGPLHLGGQTLSTGDTGGESDYDPNEDAQCDDC